MDIWPGVGVDFCMTVCVCLCVCVLLLTNMLARTDE